MMTPEQKIKHAIINKVSDFSNNEYPEVNINNVDEVYADVEANDTHWDALSELRTGQVETNIPSESSRHYESKSVAMQTPDGTWVGWTYWYGGGKHSEPESIEWMSEAYNLNYAEREETILIRQFTKF